MKKIRRLARGKKFKIQIPTRFGCFFLEATAQGLYRLQFPPKGKSAKKVPGKKGAADIRSLLTRTGGQLSQYLEGGPASFGKLRIDFSGYTPFEQKVLRTLQRVPKGRVVSYAFLARKAGVAGADRAVGSVMRKNRLPVILPCHRVVRSDGVLGRYSQGTGWKKRLLLLEGVSSGLFRARR